MADLQRLEEALRNADAAGDTQAASALAQEIRRARAPQSAPAGGGIRGLIMGDNAQNLGASQPPAPSGDAPSASRLVGLAGRGATDSTLDTIGALPDLAAWLINKAGSAFSDKPLVGKVFGGSQMLRDTRDAAVGSMAPAETTGEKLAYGAGRGVGDAASIALPAGAIAQMTRPASMAGGISRALASQPVLQAASGAAGGAVGEATGNPLLGMGAALAVPLGVAATRRMITPTTIRLGDQERALVDAAKREGIPLNIEQQTGNKTVSAINSVLRKLPFSNDLAQNADEATREAFNRAVLRRAGVNAGHATPEVLDDGFRLAGASFEDLISKTPEINLGGRFFSQVDGVVNSYGRRLPSNVAGVFQSFVDDLNAARQAASEPGARALIDGATYRRIYSDMARVMRGSDDRELVAAVGQLRGALDDAMAQSVPKELANDWRDIRRTYATLITVARAMAKAPQGAEAAGNIPFGQFKNEVRGNDPVGYARGRGQLNELARVGGYLADKMPDSGTSQRSMITQALTGGGVGGGIGAAMGNPLLGAAVGMAGPPVAYGLLNNPVTRAYMTNQLVPGSGVSSGAVGGILSGRTLDELKQLLAQQP
jgi:hypothetical protein